MGCGNSAENGKGVSKELRVEGGYWEGGKGGRLEGDIHFIRNAREKEIANMVPAMVNFIERYTEVSEFSE